MTLAVYAEAELNCDGPGKPYAECVRIPRTEEIHHTAISVPLCRKQISSIAKKAGWRHIKGKWLCEYCHSISTW